MSSCSGYETKDKTHDEEAAAVKSEASPTTADSGELPFNVEDADLRKPDTASSDKENIDPAAIQSSEGVTDQQSNLGKREVVGEETLQEGNVEGAKADKLASSLSEIVAADDSQANDHLELVHQSPAATDPSETKEPSSDDGEGLLLGSTKDPAEALTNSQPDKTMLGSQEQVQPTLENEEEVDQLAKMSQNEQEETSTIRAMLSSEKEIDGRADKERDVATQGVDVEKEPEEVEHMVHVVPKHVQVVHEDEGKCSHRVWRLFLVSRA